MRMFVKNTLLLASGLMLGNTALAVHVNPQGTGEVLLFPLYTTLAGNDTYFHITNHGAQQKILKVRLLEAVNSTAVLSFNLQLAPRDTWTGTVTRTDTGAKVITRDESITEPAFPSAGIELSSSAYQGQDYLAGTGGPQGLERTRIGHIEVIEMAPPGSNAETGGLSGSFSIINVPQGIQFGGIATALDDFWGEVTPTTATAAAHALPNLGSGSKTTEFPDGTTDSFAKGLDAVGAALLTAYVENEFVSGAGLAAETDWVVTFPTKALATRGLTAPAQPFLSIWSATAHGNTCTYAPSDRYDRDGHPYPTDIPATFEKEPYWLCDSTNILGFGQSAVIREAEELPATDEDESQSGYLQLDFSQRHLTSLSAKQYPGIPAIGFSAIKITNGDVNGLLSNYAVSWPHRSHK